MIILFLLLGFTLFIENSKKQQATNMAITNEFIIASSNQNTTNNPSTTPMPIDPDYQKNLEQLIAKRTITNVKMTVKEETITKDGATFTLVDYNELPYDYNDNIVVQRKTLFGWWEVYYSSYIQNLLAWTVHSGEPVTFKVNWKSKYGSLKKGTYRLVKKIDEKQAVYAEFTIK